MATEHPAGSNTRRRALDRYLPSSQGLLWVASVLGLCGSVAWVAAIVDRAAAAPEFLTSCASGGMLAVGLRYLAQSLGVDRSRRLVALAVGLSLLTIVVREYLGYRELLRLAPSHGEEHHEPAPSVAHPASGAAMEPGPAPAASEDEVLPRHLLDYLRQSLDDRQPFVQSRRLWWPLGAAALTLIAGLGCVGTAQTRPPA